MSYLNQMCEKKAMAHAWAFAWLASTKSTEYRSKRAKKVTTVSKTGLFWKSTDVTDNGTKKVLRYSIAVLLYHGTVHLCW